MPSGDPHLLPPVVGAVVLLLLVASAVWLVFRVRAAALRAAWRSVAAGLDGHLSEAPELEAKGRCGGYAAFLRLAVSHEDGPPYHHTRGTLNIANPAWAVMGLRHKSMLEEVTTRRDERPAETGDPDFDRAFFVLCTVPEHVPALLGPEVRRELARYGDVEVYMRGTTIEWRRAGTLRSADAILRLFRALAEIADAVRALPPRDIGLSARLAEESVLDKGV